ncbi:uncharacterized protein LOC132261666 [Phlebotomus argentipes]|uniref:uncharacterized protein LOC132261666 n=1 Tax=Phlebotomus argentipes TaxID=94469 RepID=UPI002893710C|nr:uncharacterized protein LOC132261666 [Phlebotomus argentipes]
MEYRLVCVALLALTIGQAFGTERVDLDDRCSQIYPPCDHPRTQALLPLLDDLESRNMQRASMNTYMDYVLTYIAPIFRDSGMVPMDLPDTSIGWEAQPIWITYGGIIDLHNGLLHDIENVFRAGNCYLSYNRQLLRMEILSRLSRMPFHYDYETRVMGLGIFRGWVEGHMENMVMTKDFLLDMFDFFLFMQHFRVLSIGNVHVRVRGNILTDWLANVIIDIVIFFFENTVVNLVSETLQEFIQEVIDETNANRVRFSALSGVLMESLQDPNPPSMDKFGDDVMRMFQKRINV